MEEKKKIIQQEMDGIEFSLRKATDFSFLSHYGKVFCVFDQNDSGNISFGVENESGDRFFIKVAGAETVKSTQDPLETIGNLKKTVKIYEDLRGNGLIEMVTTGNHQNVFFIVFRWVAGECLFDHWNFDYYSTHPEVDSPKEKFKKLRANEKLNVADQILDFANFVVSKNYALVDFYDGSLMYDFDTHLLTICDIDLFREMPLVNDLGTAYWGPKRIKSPEEYQLGETIDERTAVFTIGALFFNIFGSYPREVVKKMNSENRFIPLAFENWSLSKKLYDVLLKAVEPIPAERFQSIQQFKNEWEAAV